MSTVGNALRSSLLRGGRFGGFTGKKGNREYYKGKGGWKGGRITSKARFVKEESKMRYIKVPDLTGFNLTPYVAKDTPLVKVPPPKMPSV